MAKSLAFWLDGSNDSQPKEYDIELHFNFWSLKAKKPYSFGYKPISYLDIGVQIKSLENATKLDSISFYFPFEATNEDHPFKFELGKRVCESDELISAVFNCPIKATSPNETLSYKDIDFSSKKNDQPIRFFTELQTSIKIKKEADGCIVTFPILLFSNKLEAGRDGYFRFRIELNKSSKQNFMTIEKPSFKSVTNDHEVMEIVDFRVNETRNLPPSIRKKLEDTSYIKKIHFFLIQESRAEHKMSHSPYKRCRILENDLWSKYLDLDNEVNVYSNPLLIYHWFNKDDEGIDHFSAFSKFSSKPIRLQQVIAILLLSALIGIISGLTVNFFWQKVEKPVTCAKTVICSNYNQRSLNDLLFKDDRPTDKTRGVSNE
ncbi:hypothetical protein [Pseudoalteromonas fuliginea]|uniref:Uncharacterized protein n=1 Tax=Pseudoalteromonas fuliginea TaxID=1872678 RepID=A0ABD3YAL9_9GAMM|nr:hypothetical protein [Pseudoalteromonas fuliginea]KDC51624.1 hypothetical protein DC53_08635 [Pseudoalteromonas fuliginea]KJZ29710.1 hypothetical protein TW82_00205 [Pseudoalteromonas fuliginea]